MARTFGAIYLRIWRDQDWRTLGHTEQYLYMSLVCQPKLNRAGLLEYSPRRWADANATLSVHDVEVAVKNLEQRHYIVLDESTNELLVRTYVRNDEAWKQPKVMASVVSAANEIESPKLRHALLLELDRIPLDELSDAPGLNNGPSIRSKIEKCIAQLRAVLGGDGPYDPGRARASRDTPTEGYQSATDTPGVPDATGISAHADTGAVAPSQRPAPTPAPEPEPEPLGAQVVAAAPLTLWDPAPTAPAEERPMREVAHTAHSLIGLWLEYRTTEYRPDESIIKRVGRKLRESFDQQIAYPIILDAFVRWDLKGSDPNAIPSFVNESQGRARRGQPLTSTFGAESNVIPFQRGQHQAYRDDPNRDYSLAAYLAERNGA